MARQIIDPTTQSATSILNGHSIKMTPSGRSLYLWIRESSEKPLFALDDDQQRSSTGPVTENKGVQNVHS